MRNGVERTSVAFVRNGPVNGRDVSWLDQNPDEITGESAAGRSHTFGMVKSPNWRPERVHFIRMLRPSELPFA